MAIVYRPPLPDHLVVDAAAVGGTASLSPWLVGADEVDHGDTRLEVTVGRKVLVVSRRSDVVRKGQAVVGVLEVHVQEALVGAVKGDAALGHGGQGVVLADIGGEDHDTGVEQIRPADIRCSSKGVWEVEELIGSAVGDNVGVDVDDLTELGLFPEVDLGEGGVEVGAVHEVQVAGRGLVLDTRDRYYIVVHILQVLAVKTAWQRCKWRTGEGVGAHFELGNDLCGHGVEGDQNGQLLGGAGIAERVC